MTWVVGLTGLPAGGLLLADVRVTLQYPDGSVTPFDGLQKIHPITNWIAGGFAGSVDVGFSMLADFQRYIGTPPEGFIARTGYLLNRWTRRARRIYAAVPAPLRALGCELLFIGASAEPPDSPLGIQRTHGYIMRPPNFALEPLRGSQARSIGSGSVVPQYLAILERSDDEIFNLWKIDLEMGDMGHIAFAHGLTSAIEAHYERTVSEHLLVVRVKQGGFVLGNNNMEPLPPSELPSRKMPPLATNPRELYGMFAQTGLASGALAKA